jgi:hypothetical protein
MALLDKLFNKTESEVTLEAEVVETPVKQPKPEVVDGDQPLVGK